MSNKQTECVHEWRIGRFTDIYSPDLTSKWFCVKCRKIEDVY